MLWVQASGLAGVICVSQGEEVNTGHCTQAAAWKADAILSVLSLGTLTDLTSLVKLARDKTQLTLVQL